MQVWNTMMIETWYNNLANLFKEITIYFRKQIVHRFQSVSIRAGKLDDVRLRDLPVNIYRKK